MLLTFIAGLCTKLRYQLNVRSDGFKNAKLVFSHFVYPTDYEMRHYNGYGVLYKVAGESDWDRGTRTGFDTGDVTLSVKPFTNYSVRVFVRSNKGDAVIGPAHNVTTPEGGT